MHAIKILNFKFKVLIYTWTCNVKVSTFLRTFQVKSVFKSFPPTERPHQLLPVCRCPELSPYRDKKAVTFGSGGTEAHPAADAILFRALSQSRHTVTRPSLPVSVWTSEWSTPQHHSFIQRVFWKGCFERNPKNRNHCLLQWCLWKWFSQGYRTVSLVQVNSVFQILWFKTKQNLVFNHPLSTFLSVCFTSVKLLAFVSFQTEVLGRSYSWFYNTASRNLLLLIFLEAEQRENLRPLSAWRTVKKNSPPPKKKGLCSSRSCLRVEPGQELETFPPLFLRSDLCPVVHRHLHHLDFVWLFVFFFFFLLG